VVPYVSQPGAPVYTRASFVTQAGNPGLVPVSESPVQGTRSSAAAIESDVERAEAQSKADLERR
jgi:alkaline phosphatase D